MTDWIVALLQGQASLECLDVGELGLSFDAGTPSRRGRAAYHGVPGSKVAVDRKRHLRAPAEAWMESHPEAFEQCELSTISNRIARRIRTDAQVEPQDRAPGANVGDADAIQLAMFEAPQLAVGSPGRSGRIAQAQSGRDPGVPMLLAETTKRVSRSPAASISWTFSRSHRREGCTAGLHRRSTGAPPRIDRLCYASRNNERRSGPNRTGQPVPAAPCYASRNTCTAACGDG
jgi:hypothetical protein